MCVCVCVNEHVFVCVRVHACLCMCVEHVNTERCIYLIKQPTIYNSNIVYTYVTLINITAYNII